MAMKSSGRMIAAAVVSACVIGSAMQMDAQVFSQNTVGYLSAKLMTGAVVQVKTPGDFSRFETQPERAVMKDVLFIMTFTTGLPKWIRPQGGTVNELQVQGVSLPLIPRTKDAYIQGKRIGVETNTFVDGCIEIEGVGNVPVAFHEQVPGIKGYSIFAMDFSEEQLAKLRKLIAAKKDVLAR